MCSIIGVCTFGTSDQLRRERNHAGFASRAFNDLKDIDLFPSFKILPEIEKPLSISALPWLIDQHSLKTLANAGYLAKNCRQ